MNTPSYTMKTRPDFITINGIRFARNASLLVSSLFDASGTASGIYSVRKNGVLLSAPNGEPRVFVVNNRHGEQFLVTCHRIPDGRTRYMHALSSLDVPFVGLSSGGYRIEHETARTIIDQLS